MKKIPFILALTFFAVLMAGEIRDFFIRDEGGAYFKNDWHRFLYVLAIGLIGGLGFGLFALCSKKMQARIKYLLSGFTAICCICFTIYFLAEMTKVGVWASQNISSTEIVLIFAGSFLVNAVLLLECWFLRKRTLAIK